MFVKISSALFASGLLFSATASNDFLKDTEFGESPIETGVRFVFGTGSMDDFEYNAGNGISKKDLDTNGFRSLQIYGRYFFPVELAGLPLIPFVEGGFRTVNMEEDEDNFGLNIGNSEVDLGYKSFDLTVSGGVSYLPMQNIKIRGMMGITKSLFGLEKKEYNDSSYEVTDAFGLNISTEALYVVNHRAQFGAGLALDNGTWEYELKGSGAISGKYESSYSAASLYLVGSLSF